MKNDPWETRNLIDDPRHLAVVEQHEAIATRQVLPCDAAEGAGLPANAGPVLLQRCRTLQGELAVIEAGLREAEASGAAHRSELQEARNQLAAAVAALSGALALEGQLEKAPTKKQKVQ